MFIHKETAEALAEAFLSANNAGMTHEEIRKEVRESLYGDLGIETCSEDCNDRR